MSDGPIGFWRTVVEDLRSNVDASRQTPVKYWLVVIAKALFAPQAHAVMKYRVSHALYGMGLKPLGIMLRTASLRAHGTEIHPAATIGPGFCLVHTSGVVIGPGTVIGRNCRVVHGATIGEPGRGSRDALLSPVIGDDVTVGAHAVVVGPYRIGDRAIVGANSVVIEDVPAGAVVGGVPARVLRSDSTLH